MNLGHLIPIVAIIATAWVVVTFMRFRHQSGPSVADDRKVELLSAENSHLKGQVSRLEERLAVLERIATDPAERTAREIEQLRVRTTEE